MKWTITINQKGAMDANLDVDMIDLAIFDMLKSYVHSHTCKRMVCEGKVYYSVPYKKVIEELPLLPIKKTDGIYRRYKRLELAGVLEMHPDNAKLGMTWFSWGRNYDKLEFVTHGLKTEGMPETPGLKTDPPRIENRTPPDEKPTHPISYPISYPTTATTEAAAAEKPLPLEEKKEKERITPGGGPGDSGSGIVPGWRPIDFDSELARMQHDQSVQENFRMRCKLPLDVFQSYISDFTLHVKSHQKTYSNTTELRSHFFNYCDRHKQKQTSNTSTTIPALRRAGQD